jgi:predicted Zn-dependent protease with MMP-like domain
MDELPAKYIKGLENVAIVMADRPSAEQLRKMQIDKRHSLLGLYEGIPLTQRGAGYNLVLPDKITLFKNTIEQNCQDENQIFETIKRTLWHEIAHFYGLSHADIDRIQKS